MTARTTTEAPADHEKEFAQIVVPDRSAHLYLPEWSALCSGGGVTTLRKPIRMVKEGDN